MKLRTENWMTTLQPWLQDRCLGDTMLPGTHNSGSFSITTDNARIVDQMIPLQLGFKLGLKKFVVDWAVNHQGDFSEQLAHGYRVFDLRICYLPETDCFHWWHGVSGANITPGLQQIKEFVQNHSNEIVILRVSHLNSPGSSVKCRRQDIPSPKLKDLGNLIHSTFCDSLVPSKLFTAKTMFREIWASERNVFVFIEDTLYNRLGHPGVFVYNWADKRVHGAKFKFLTNPRRALQYREVTVSTQRNSCDDVMTYNPFIVTHQTVNMIGALLQTNALLALSTLVSLLCYLGYISILGGAPTTQGAMLSLLVCFIGSLAITQFLGFEGQADTLVEMSRLANLHGMGAVGFPFNRRYPRTQIFNKSFNEVLRIWSQLQNKYKLNIITVDDFHSSDIVDIAIDFARNLKNVPQGDGVVSTRS